MGAQIGLEQQYEIPVELGDGRIISRGLALAEVEVEGIRRPMLIALAAEGEPPLLGYTALELLGFKVNPVTRKLEKTIAIEY
jgi:predicted aspartyl protease